MFHPQWREQAIAALDRPFDLVVVGGGITGCGVFFDAAQRGLRVLLVEKGDIASGTSSRSSKLLHGGLRYLKEMQLRVTRTACRERDRQLALNPNLARPIQFVYPAYRSAETPRWQVELGLWIYDRMTQGPDKHRSLDPEELASLVPGLEQEGLDRALVYLDAQVDDARLTLSVAATGSAYGGWLLTRMAAVEPTWDAEKRISGLVLRDMDTELHHRVETSLVVNAAGAGVDHLRRRLGLGGRTVRPSRGTHLIFDAARLPIEAAVTMLSPDDRRPVFFIPHPEGLLVGTTDIFHDGDVDDPRPSRGEVAYLLRTVAAAFPDDPPGEDEVLGAFAGVRPVLDNDSDDPSAASREEAIWYENGLLSVAGGKLTTWRATAEETVDEALEHLPDQVARRATRCATAGTALVGLAPEDLAHRLEAAHGLTPEVAGGLARRLGAMAWTACALADPTELRPLRDDVDLTAAEVRTHLRFGAVCHLSDLLLRRTRLGMWKPQIAHELAPKLSGIVCPEMDWSSHRFEQELQRFEIEAESWTLQGVQPGGDANKGSGSTPDAPATAPSSG